MEDQRKDLCYNCFQEKSEGRCPYCGFDLEENAKKYPVAMRAGSILKGRYLVGRVLGQGGFGITYLAYDQKLLAKVAVKEYMPGELALRLQDGRVAVRSAGRKEDFAYGREGFQKEAHILAKFMGQPNIAGVTDYFDENDTSYFVMDYIEGISFKTYIANRGGRVAPQEALDVMIPILRALSAVHREGLIHRDVTPDNIYITKDGNVKLLDFGSARYSLGDKSKSLDVILKVGYAPKEQYIRRGRQGLYTDVYSCAACLYAAITGYLPPESLERLDQDTLPPPSEAGVEIPLYLERAILKGLAVQPEDRFQTAEEFLETLESQQVAELAAVPRIQEPEQAEKKRAGKKFPIAAAAIGSTAALLALFALGSMINGQRTLEPENPLTAETDYGRENGAVGDRKEISVQEERTIKEAAAPKVTICGKTYSTAAVELQLENAAFTEEDFQALAQMTALERLEIVDSPINSLDCLSNLTGLKRLHIRGSSEAAGTIPDLSALSGLVNMEDLYLYLDGLSDLSGVAGMTKLKSLVMTGSMNISDLSPLSGLTELETLEVPGVGENVGVDLSPLSGLTKLETLRTGSNVVDLSPLSGLTKLRELDLTYGGYSSSDSKEYQSLEPLASLTELTSLTIRNLKVGDLSSLSNLNRLRSLTIYNAASIRDLSPLAGLKNLKSLTIRGARYELDTSALSQVSNISIER